MSTTSKRYNIVDRLRQANARPIVQLSEDLEVKVSNTKTTALLIQAISEDDNLTQDEKTSKILIAAVGETQFKKIDELIKTYNAAEDEEDKEISFQAWVVILNAISAAVTGEELEEIDLRFPEAETEA